MKDYCYACIQNGDGSISWEEFLVMITPAKLAEADKPRLVRPEQQQKEQQEQQQHKKQQEHHHHQEEEVAGTEANIVQDSVTEPKLEAISEAGEETEDLKLENDIDSSLGLVNECSPVERLDKNNEEYINTQIDGDEHRDDL